MNLTSLPLFIPGEVQGQPISFSKSVVLWASPFDEGADELATELATNFSGLTVSTAEEAGDATHMLLYLNADTWSDERLAEQVKQARQDRLKIVMAHENDPDLGGCLFSRFFEVTPQERAGVGSLCSQSQALNLPSPAYSPLQELIADGLYKSLARSCFPGRHHPARVLSPPHLALRIGGTLTSQGAPSAGVARASGKGPRRDSRSVGQRRKHEPPLGQHRRARQPARPQDLPPQLHDGNHRGRRLWRRGDGLGGLGGVGGLGGGGAGACLVLAAAHTANAILSNSHEHAPATRGAGEAGRRVPHRRPPRVWVHIRRALSHWGLSRRSGTVARRAFL